MLLSDWRYIDCLWALTVTSDFDLKLNTLPLTQSLAVFAATDDAGEMDEDIFAAIIGGNETKPLGIIEPLYCSDLHAAPLG
jgi:hypothetical protein